MADGSGETVKRKYKQVVEAAREVFLEDGYHGASVDEIARRAKISKATLYRYFESKSELFNEIARREIAREGQIGTQNLNPDLDPIDVLNAVGLQYTGFMLSPFGSDLYRLIAAERHRFPDVAAAFYSEGRQYVISVLAKYFEQAEKVGKLKIDDKELAASQLIDLVRGELFSQVMFLGATEDSAETERVVASGVEVFLARYGT